MITWSVVLQYVVTRLVLVCIYVTPPMKHIYTGIKYIALYNIICVWYRKNLFNEGKGKGLGPGNAASPVLNMKTFIWVWEREIAEGRVLYR